MSERRYAVGDHVHVTSNSLSGPMVSGAFEVLQLYPGDARGPMYRLRSLMSRHERMAPGQELRPTKDSRAAANSLFGRASA